MAEEAKSNDSAQSPPPAVVEEDDFDVTNEDWGTYYDPKNIFCGQYDCYKILGFDYESFGKNHPDTKVITKRFRKLSREWHPDKSSHTNAKEKFVKISRAYEVLTSKEQRTEYDAMRYDQEAYFAKYGTSVLWSYAPKTDGTLVALILFIAINVASWYMQKHRWSLVANRLIKAAVEDWTPSMGGTPESKHLREEALAILAEQEKQNEDDSALSKTSTTNSKKKSKGKKVSGKEKKQQEMEALTPIVTDLVNEMKDFGGGFHQPTWRDLFIVGLARLPLKIVSGAWWQTKYAVRRLQKKPLSDEEKEVLTAQTVGPIVWDTSSDEDRQGLVQRELWIKDNLLDWNEEQEIKKLSITEQKNYMRMKKRGKLD